MDISPKQVLDLAAKYIGYHEKASNSNLDSKTANSGSKNFTKYGRDLFNAGRIRMEDNVITIPTEMFQVS